jgi:hypothetical protein
VLLRIGELWVLNWVHRETAQQFPPLSSTRCVVRAAVCPFGEHQEHGSMRQIGLPIHDYDGLHEALRLRKQEMQVSFATIDLVSGLPGGLASKLLSPSKLRGLGLRSARPHAANVGRIPDPD